MIGREEGVADAEHSTFWNDLTHDLEDPQFLREYVAQSIRIATIDRIVNELDAARETAGLSKAELARAINSEPAAVRRLFSAGQVNPTQGTLAEVAAALGMRVVLEPLEAGDRKHITGPLLAGSTDAPEVLARRLDAMRRKPGASASALSLDHAKIRGFRRRPFGLDRAGTKPVSSKAVAVSPCACRRFVSDGNSNAVQDSQELGTIVSC
jgi:transcriptional regulator with XRE-family HTH domain